MDNFVLQVLTRLQTIELKREEGQTMAEYGLLLALIAVVVALALPALATALSNLFNSIAGTLN